MNLVDAIELYYSLGFSIIPIRPGEKVPATTWEKYQHSRPSDDDIIKWWKDKRLGIGIVTGSVSGNLCVLDFETVANFEEFLSANPAIATNTLCVYTGKGGHVYLRGDYPVESRGKGTDQWLGLFNLEISGEERQVLAPPSLHPSGKQYTLREGCGMSVLEVGDVGAFLRGAFSHLGQTGQSMPDSIIRPYSPTERVTEPFTTDIPREGISLDGMIREVLTAPNLDGTWHERMTRVIGYLAGARVPLSLIEMLMRQAAEKSSWKESRSFQKDFDALLDTARNWRDDAVREQGELIRADTPATALERVYIGQAIREGVPPAQWLLEDVMVRGRIHLLYGEPESGKTIILLAWVLCVIAEGRDVLLIDEESGLASIASLLSAMGADPDVVDRHVHYFPFPSIDKESYGAVVAYADMVQPALVAFDSLTDMLTTAGLDENSGNQVTEWMLEVAQAIARRVYAPSVALVDHITKDAGNTKYSVASRAKKAKSDVLWYVEKAADFDQTKTAQVKLYRHKNRPGVLPKMVTYTIGGQDGQLICRRFDAALDSASTLSDKSKAMLEILRKEGKPMQNSELVDAYHAMTGENKPHRDTMRAWLDPLVYQGHAEEVRKGPYVAYVIAGSVNASAGSVDASLTGSLTDFAPPLGGDPSMPDEVEEDPDGIGV